MSKNKFLIFWCLIFICINFVACKNNNINFEANTMEDCVAYEVSQIENLLNYDDEEIKALCVVVRTKLYNNPSMLNKNFDKSKINEKIKTLANSTSGEILKNGENTANITYSTKNIDEVWHENIKKSKILKFMLNKGVSLSNISNIEPQNADDGTLKALKVGGKEISYEELKNDFNLQSNKITDIKNNFSSIDIYGVMVEDKNCFYMTALNDYSFENYKQNPNETVTKREDNKIIIEFKSDNEFKLIQKILSYGDDCTVISPLHIREKVINILKEMQALYEE